MKPFNQLVLVNYSHPDCVPLLNIMRLPKEEAFRLAEEFAREHPEGTAFGGSMRRTVGIRPFWNSPAATM